MNTENRSIASLPCLFQTKLASLEEKLLREERERLLVQEKADQVGSVCPNVPSRSSFSLKWISNNDGLLLHSCRRSWTQTSRHLPQSQRRSKAHRKQSPPEYFLFPVPLLLFHGGGVCFSTKVTSAVFPLRKPLCAVRGLHQVGQSPRKCLLLPER